MNGDTKKKLSNAAKHPLSITTLAGLIVFCSAWAGVKTLARDAKSIALKGLGIQSISADVNELTEHLIRHGKKDDGQDELIDQNAEWIRAFEESQRSYQKDMLRIQEDVKALNKKVNQNQQVIMEILQG